MRSTAIIGILAAVLTGATVPAAAATTQPPAEVNVASCSREEASAAFYGRMRRVPGTAWMSMRFTLLERDGTGHYSPIRAPGLGRWLSSQAGVAAFGYRQEVLNLAANVAYRVRVDYRWHGEPGELLQRARRRSRPCRQYAGLPNLRVRLLDMQPSEAAGVFLYRVTLTNAGEAAATETSVELAVDGLTVDSRTAAALAPSESRAVTFRGPACKSTLEAHVDPDGLVAETAETDNSHTVVCAKIARRR